MEEYRAAAPTPLIPIVVTTLPLVKRATHHRHPDAMPVLTPKTQASGHHVPNHATGARKQEPIQHA